MEPAATGALRPVAPSAARHRRVFFAVLLALCALSWFALWIWARSPYGRYLEHGDWTASGPAAIICRTLPAGEWLLPASLYSAAWVLMIGAMMLPTTLPLFDAFDRITRHRKDHRPLMLLLGLGYVAVWAAFGLLAHGLHALLLGLIEAVPTFAWHAGWIGVAVIAIAGAFQFTELKYRCLDKCRTPRSFVIEHWRGKAPRLDALSLGAHHGLFCVGCCWALMLLMFAVGMGSLGWMLLLAAAMAVEKNMPWGRRLSAPLGVALLAWAGLLALTGL